MREVYGVGLAVKKGWTERDRWNSVGRSDMLWLTGLKARQGGSPGANQNNG